jgi:hypothetical protein
MRTCSLCQTTAPDSVHVCANCGADLARHSVTATTLARLRGNPRVSRIRLIVAADACPACKAAEGDFDKRLAPDLPVIGCSHALGCRCFYEPLFTQIYP